MFGDTNVTWKDTRAVRQKTRFLQWLKQMLGSLNEKDQPLRRSQRGAGVGPKAEKVVILEVGCGVSIHSLRLEAEMLITMKTDSTVNCVRINPVTYEIKGQNNVGIGMGSLECLVGISKLLGL